MEAQRRKLLPWIVGAVIGLPSLYVLSFGPVCWCAARSSYAGIPAAMGAFPMYRMSVRAPAMYWPIGYLAKHSKGGVGYKVIDWYARGEGVDTVIVNTSGAGDGAPMDLGEISAPAFIMPPKGP